MFRFFQDMPEEVTLNILDNMCVTGQALIAQSSSDMNRIAGDSSSALTCFKFLNHGCQIGNALITFLHNDPPIYSEFIIRDISANSPQKKRIFSISPRKADELADLFKAGQSILDALQHLDLPQIVSHIISLNIQTLDQTLEENARHSLTSPK